MKFKPDANTLTALSNIHALLSQADNLFNALPRDVQDSILEQHNVDGSLNHCLRWGIQAASELLKANDINPVPDTSSIQVCHWDRNSEIAQYSHVMSIQDKRLSDCQLFVEVEGIDKDVENFLAVTIEINSLPGTDRPVPCAHIHFDDNRVAFSAFKVGGTIILRPETDVKIEDKLLLNNESCYLLT